MNAHQRRTERLRKRVMRVRVGRRMVGIYSTESPQFRQCLARVQREIAEAKRLAGDPSAPLIWSGPAAGKSAS